jgi:hypothetical protein
MTHDPRYPIGVFDAAQPVTADARARAIEEIAALPEALRAAVRGLTPEQLDTPCREGGWSPRQIVHHVPDSHMNGYGRTKLALTEDVPTIKPYDEHRWALLGDTSATPIEVSLDLVTALHARWAALLRTMSEADYERVFHHPETGRDHRLDTHVASYAWHGRHHAAQILALRERKGWR